MTQDVFSEWQKLSCGPLAGKLDISIRKQVTMTSASGLQAP